MDHYVNRRLSGPLTRWFLKTSLTPNQITLLSFGVGLLSAFFFGMGGYYAPIVGAAIFQFSAVLDCCDGEVARRKGMQSRLGQWLDLVCDNVVHVALFLAMSWAGYRSTGEPSVLLLGFSASIGSLLSLWLVVRSSWGLDDRPETDRQGPSAFYLSDAERARLQGRIRKTVNQMTNRDFSVVILLFALLGRIDLFLWLAAVGSHLFWIILLWLRRRESRLDLLKNPSES